MSKKLFKHFSDIIFKNSDTPIDYTGKQCTNCNKGVYAVTSFNDDMNGTLHCINCNHEINRWSYS